MSLRKILKKYQHLNSKFDWDSGTDKNTMHSYVENFYEKEFERYKTSKITLCEVGVWTGCSLLLWSKLFAKDSRIIGIETDVSHLNPEISLLPNIFIINSDAYDKQVVDNLPQLDIAIDDGPHTVESQVKFAELYCGKMKKGGILVIEDVSSIENFNIIQKSLPTDLGKKLELHDFRRTKNRGDDIIACLRF
jgi:cephalosporin hydroxylase